MNMPFEQFDEKPSNENPIDDNALTMQEGATPLGTRVTDAVVNYRNISFALIYLFGMVLWFQVIDPQPAWRGFVSSPMPRLSSTLLFFFVFFLAAVGYFTRFTFAPPALLTCLMLFFVPQEGVMDGFPQAWWNHLVLAGLFLGYCITYYRHLVLHDRAFPPTEQKKARAKRRLRIGRRAQANPSPKERPPVKPPVRRPPPARGEDEGQFVVMTVLVVTLLAAVGFWWLISLGSFNDPWSPLMAAVWIAVVVLVGVRFVVSRAMLFGMTRDEATVFLNDTVWREMRRELTHLSRYVAKDRDYHPLPGQVSLGVDQTKNGPKSAPVPARPTVTKKASSEEHDV